MFHIEEVLRSAGITQADLARAIGRSPAAVSMFLHGSYKGNGEKLRRRIRQALAGLGVPAEEMDTLWDIVPDAPELSNVIELKPKLHQEDTMQRGLNQEVLKWYGLFRDPFTHPEGRDEVFRSHNLQMAESAIVDAGERHQFVAVIGETGSGKTTARDSALDRLYKSGKVHVIYPEPLISERLTAPMICTTILGELQEVVPQEMVRRTTMVRKVLSTVAEKNENVLLVIEEAHLLHPSTLRSLKHLYEVQQGFRKLLGILLVGQPALETMLGRMSLEEVSSRCRRVRLMEMSLEETGAYLEHRIRAVRGDAEVETIFTPDAVAHIAARAKHPQQVNNLARQLMERAWQVRHLTNSRAVTREVLTA